VVYTIESPCRSIHPKNPPTHPKVKVKSIQYPKSKKCCSESESVEEWYMQEEEEVKKKGARRRP
jgi:hypothetical protein